MKIDSFLNRFSHSPIPRLAIVMLIAMACSTPIFCGEIHDAAKAGDLAKVKALLKENPKLVLSKDKEGWTPLHVAAENGCKDVVELLLASKADVNAIGKFGLAPLHLAARKGSKDVAQLLLANKARVNARNNNRETPLHLAALKGDLDMVELLLTNKADVNAKDKEGETPMYWAGMGGHKDVKELLRQHRGHE
jgi:ankyrin repeat protein